MMFARGEEAENFAPKFPHNSNGQFYECVNSNGSCQRRKDNDNDDTDNTILVACSLAASCTKVIKFDIKSCNKIITGPSTGSAMCVCVCVCRTLKSNWSGNASGIGGGKEQKRAGGSGYDPLPCPPSKSLQQFQSRTQSRAPISIAIPVPSLAHKNGNVFAPLAKRQRQVKRAPASSQDGGAVKNKTKPARK